MTTPTKLSVVFAGEVFDNSKPSHPWIVLHDGSLHTVRVRAMPSRHLGRVLALADREAELLEFCCTVAVVIPKTETEAERIDWQPMTPEFVDSLDDTSHKLLVETAGRLNFTRAVQQAERSIAAGSLTIPLMEKADALLKPLAEKLASSVISSLAQSGSPAAPLTKS